MFRDCLISLLFILLGLPIFSVLQAMENKPFSVDKEGLSIRFEFFKDHLRQRTLLPAGMNLPDTLAPMQDITDIEVALHVTGLDRLGRKRIGGQPGTRLIFNGMSEQRTDKGTQVTLTQFDPETKLKVESLYLFFHDTPVIRRCTRVTNEGKNEQGLEYVSSVMLNNYGDLGSGSVEEKLVVHWAHNSWFAEGQWHASAPSELGWAENRFHQLSGISLQNLGSWSTVRYLPMAMIENRSIGVTWFWQIEHNGSWFWEMSDSKSAYDMKSNHITMANAGTYLYVGGPDEETGQAWKRLKPGESYVTVPVAIGCVRGGFGEGVAALTAYRRMACLQPHPDNRDCPVVFNDYMNCLMADPTTEKLIPVIDAAARAGAHYFMIDAGWYGELNENWWVSRGLYLPSKTRFKDGLQAVLDYIRARGMVPGLWLEIENPGMNSPLKTKPDDWFFIRHGKRVTESGSNILDFRNPEVRRYADEIVDRLVQQYKVGYIKIDYNVNALMGTEYKADSPGQGLLEHNRAFLNWLDHVYKRFPNLTIENCGSGGCRMDYAMLSRNQVQSSSDQMDYRKYPSIITGCFAAVLPEQLAAWSYPLAEADADQASFNMIGAMMGRMHLSGRIDRLAEQSFSVVQNGVSVYKKEIQPIVPSAVPFFPLGMSALADDVAPVALGLNHASKNIIAVWRLNGKPVIRIPNVYDGEAKLLYPVELDIRIDQSGRDLLVMFPRPYMGAIIEIRH